MKLCCTLCNKEIKSIDQLFQCFSQQSTVQSTILESDKPKTITHYDVLVAWARYVRGHSIYRINHPSICEPIYSYYCAQCGPQFKDTTIYLGPINIKQERYSYTDLRSVCLTQSQSQGLQFTPGRGVYGSPITSVVTEQTLLLPQQQRSLSGDASQRSGYRTPPNGVSDVPPHVVTTITLNDFLKVKLENLEAEHYPSLLIDLYRLSDSLKQFFIEAIQKRRSLTQHLYSKCNGAFNSQKVIQSWLQEAEHTIQRIDIERSDESTRKFNLHRASRLTVKAVEQLLVKADKTYLPRPGLTRWLLLCIALLGMLTYIIVHYGAHFPRKAIPFHPTPDHRNQTSTTTTTMSTTTFNNPCHVADECANEVYRQLIEKLTLLLHNGCTTVGDLYRHCRDYQMFNFFREVCFATDPDFADKIIEGAKTQALIDYLASLVG